MSYYTPDVFGHTDAPGGYGVPMDYSAQVDPLSFLEEYLQKGIKLPNRLGDPREQELFERSLEQQNPGGIRVDPNKLDLREFRDPTAPSGPGEFLERDQFLLGPRSPLAQIAPRMVRNVYTGYQGDRYVITPEDKLNMMMDYRDVLEHDKNTLKGVFGPLQAPWTMAILFSNQLASRGVTPDLAAELSRDPVVLKGEFLGRLGYAAPVIGQILTRPNPYRDALIKARLYKASDFSMPTDTEALGLSNYGDAGYYSSEFGRYT